MSEAPVPVAHALCVYAEPLAERGGEEEEPAVSVDTQLAGETEAPQAFIALASQQDVRLEPYAIVQLPRARPTDVELAVDEAIEEILAPAVASPSHHAELAA